MFNITVQEVNLVACVAGVQRGGRGEVELMRARSAIVGIS